MTVIAKAKRLCGKNLFLRDITEGDAAFVFYLRTDPLKRKHISTTPDRLEDQIGWIQRYKEKNDQAYFIICDKDNNRLGCVRMYDPIRDSYCWGSWLMINGLDPFVAIESSLLVYAYGDFLGFSEARIDVRQGNEDVWKFHERFAGAELIDQNDLDRFYVVKREKICRILTKYRHLLTYPLVVDQLEL
jgi:hypothetical protein